MLIAALLGIGCEASPAEADDGCAAEFQPDPNDADVRTIGVQVPLEGGGSVQADLRWPESRDPGATWPVAILLHGAWDPAGTPLEPRSIRPRVTEGIVGIHMDFPGNGRTDGVNDHRGAASRASVAAVLQWAAGAIRDRGGCTLAERVPGTDPGALYLVGTSNGGNLAAATLAEEGVALPPVSGLIVWETPAGPQFANVEFGTANSVYTAGTCLLTDETGIVCALPPERLITAGTGSATRLCFDRDDDGDCGDADVTVAGVDDGATGLRYLSPTLTEAAAIAGLELSGYADATAADAWWAERDAARLAPRLVTAQPELPVMILASEADHVQTFPDHPHVYGLGEALQRAGAAWTRLNPGQAWLPSAHDENAPNIPLTLANPTASLLAEDAENPTDALLAAAVRELYERSVSGEW